MRTALVLARRGLAVFLLAVSAAGGAEAADRRRLAQLIMPAVDVGEEEKALAFARDGAGGLQLQWGSYSLEETRGFTEILRAAAGIPPIIAVDYEGGSVHIPLTLGLLDLPSNMMLGAADDENNTASLFYLAGRELKRAGVDMTFGPVLDVNTNPENPIIGIRSIGSDPARVARIGGAIMSGFRAAGIMTVMKHFPGHGAAGRDSHKVLPTIGLDREELERDHVAPFRASAAAAPAAMTAHIIYPALDPSAPATLSSAVIRGLLREDLDFSGAVLTDSLDMKAITSFRSVPRAAVLALKAGADLLLIGRGDFSATLDALEAAADSGELPLSRIDDAWSRVMKLKKDYGLMDRRGEDESPFERAYLRVSGELSAKAVTLLADRAGLVPLPEEYRKKRIAIILFGPSRFSAQALPLYKGLLRYGYEGARQYSFGISPSARDTKKILSYAREADLLVIGSFQWAQAQNSAQTMTIRSLLELGKPSVVVSLMNPYDTELYPEAGAVMATYGISRTSMAAAAKILSGIIAPVGKPPVELKVSSPE
ncbi:MAG: glycoside hydrolase family 3 N-terminal domain-containing protein [Elusimicrobiales bacterium]|nr:glycoside hydrolase family 3 N-terminal domain-containing protein [Elusimicrobiales bacterium]